jgi:hypothetical protein
MISDKVIPRNDHWYLELQDERSFTVIDFDEDEGLIEIQYFDGELAEMDLDEWEKMSLEEIDQPEDWTGPIDRVEPDDLDFE